MNELTNDDLADFYREKTGRNARKLKIQDVYKWATQRKEIIVNKDSTLSFKRDEAKSKTLYGILQDVEYIRNDIKKMFTDYIFIFNYFNEKHPDEMDDCLKNLEEYQKLKEIG